MRDVRQAQWTKYQPSIPQRIVYDEDIESDRRQRGMADKKNLIKEENSNT